jgi:hypothetical protein
MVGQAEKYPEQYGTAMKKSIWATPALLGILTLFGLLAALLGLGVWHWLSWIALCIPLSVIAWQWGRAGRANRMVTDRTVTSRSMAGR